VQNSGINFLRILMMGPSFGFNMKLRWKFLAILLVFSLTPLIVVTFITQRGTSTLGKVISDESRRKLTEMVSQELQLTAENSAKVLLRTKDAMEFYLHVLAGEAERALAEAQPESARIYFAGDFDDPRTAPKDYLPSTKYSLKTHDGQFLANSVSFNHPVFLLGPGVMAEGVTDDIASLTGLIPVFRNFAKEFGHMLLWAYVSLESGVHVSYPGHFGYPDDYDPRKRPWFANAQNTATWTRPLVDVTSGRVIFTVSKRIYRRDGSFLGVTAIDILLSEFLQESELSPLWSSDVRSFMVASEAGSTGNRSALQILAQKDYQTKAQSWLVGIEKEWLAVPRNPKFQFLLRQLMHGKSGYVDLPYKGIDSIWAYAGIDVATHFVIIVPKSVVMSLPDETSKTILEYASDQLIFSGETILAALLFLAAVAFIGSRTTTRTLLRIADAAKKLSAGDFSVKLQMRTGDERDQVIQAFNEMGPKLEDHLRLHRSIDLAMKVQQKLLPAEDPVIPWLDVAGRSVYCDETGGDYYDYLGYTDNNSQEFTVVVGDVSGHGISSALLMASARAYLRQRISLTGSLAQMITDVNRQLAIDVADSNSFMTLFCLKVDQNPKSLTWVRAGHDPAILYDSKKDVFEELQGEGIPLGADGSWVYAQNTRSEVLKEQIIFIGTDGIWETLNPGGEMFGKKRVQGLIRQNASGRARDIVQAIFDDLNRFRRGKKFEDDVTLVVLKIK
jgi:sigma-B regulation protein RsbU (phosphoserine phosphatase)